MQLHVFVSNNNKASIECHTTGTMHDFTPQRIQTSSKLTIESMTCFKALKTVSKKFPEQKMKSSNRFFLVNSRIHNPK